MHRVLLMGAAASAGLLLTACEGRVNVRSDREVRAERAERNVVRPIARLDCPEREAQLTRTAVAADGSSCSYAGANGAEVQMQLVALNGRSAAELLEPYGAQLETLMPAAGDEGGRIEINGDGHGDEAHIRLPGIAIDADDTNARVRIGNVISIDANETDGGVVSIRSDDETVNIRGNDDRAEIRTEGGPDGAVRSTYILASGTPSPAGWRLVGYEARGPAAGPIVVAVVKAKERESDNTFDAMKDLVERNVGG